MSGRTRFHIVLSAVLALLSGCSSTPAARTLVQNAVTAMGGAEKIQSIHTLSMVGGNGKRLRLGQMVKATETETAGELQNVTETVDLANGRASLDYELQLGGFMQHRHEILTKRGDKLVGIEIVGTRPIIMVGGHGGVGSYTDFLKAAAPPASSN